jgi:acyl homoserine lactone synthase
MMMREEGGILRGCWRLLPTVGPYMLKDSFPAFLHGHKNGIAQYLAVTATAIERMLRRAGLTHPDLLN